MTCALLRGVGANPRDRQLVGSSDVRGRLQHGVFSRILVSPKRLWDQIP